MSAEPEPGTRAGTRTEHDLLGELQVPADAYYGVHTARAKDNFRMTGVPIGLHADLVWALGCVKEAAAEANRQLGLLDHRRADAIVAACREVQDGKLGAEFVVDVIQGGAGTSTNMNANEVIANRALEILGHARGEYAFLHPLQVVTGSPARASTRSAAAAPPPRASAPTWPSTASRPIRTWSA